MLVTAVGEHSQYGILKKNIQASDDETPLQQKLAILADQIGKVGMYSAALTFLCMLGHIIYDASITPSMMGALLTVDTLHKLVEAFIIAVSISSLPFQKDCLWLSLLHLLTVLEK